MHTAFIPSYYDILFLTSPCAIGLEHALATSLLRKLVNTQNLLKAYIIMCLRIKLSLNNDVVSTVHS